MLSPMRSQVRLLQMGAVVLALFPSSAPAQGGPPFRTDDPDTPGNKHWEINIGFMGDRNPAEGSYALPNLDVNYGLGERIQLKYELPLSMQEFRDASGHLAAGLGNSLLGVKWRFYERALPEPSPRTGDDAPKFAVSTYPQLVLNNPTRSKSRGIVEPGPQLLFPIEAEAKIGPIRICLETGRWFRHDTPDMWVHGLMLGRQFSRKTEVYLELYNQRAAIHPDDRDIDNELTLGVGTRRPVNRAGSVRFLGMAGRSLRLATEANGQPSWIAYVGLQFRVGNGTEPSGNFRR